MTTDPLYVPRHRSVYTWTTFTRLDPPSRAKCRCTTKNPSIRSLCPKHHASSYSVFDARHRRMMKARS